MGSGIEGSDKGEGGWFRVLSLYWLLMAMVVRKHKKGLSLEQRRNKNQRSWI